MFFFIFVTLYKTAKHPIYCLGDGMEEPFLVNKAKMCAPFEPFTQKNVYLCGH